MNTAKENLEADVVVIGGGGAGMAAAAAAAEQGAGVIVLERRGFGGSSAQAFGIFAVDNPAQQDECFQKAMDWAHWRINPRILRAFIDKSGDSVHWLKKMGLEFEPGPPGSEQQIVPRLIKGRGAALIKVLSQYCTDKGVQLLKSTPARKILIGDGHITGVLAENNGNEFIINTRSVVIATGGFAGNKELLRKYCSDYHDNMERIGVPNNGDGLIMALDAGAATEGLGSMLIGMPKALHPPYDPAEKVSTPQIFANMGIIAIATDPRTFRVNKLGKRFFNESLGMGENAIVRQPGNVCYTIFDSGIARDIARKGSIQGGMNMQQQTQEQASSEDKLPGFEEALHKLQANKDFVKIFDSLNEMASWIDIDSELLNSEINKYNTDCDGKRDSLFAKDSKFMLPVRIPPYYVIRWSASILNTIGGIKINEHTEVMDKQDNPIPGLYAAGVDTGGWESPTYCWQIAGHAFGFAIYSGRIAGENAALFVLGK